MRVNYSAKFINEVLDYLSLEGMTKTVQKYQVSNTTLHRWLLMKELHGSEVFNKMGKSTNKYDSQFKINAVKYALDQGFGLTYTASEFLVNHITLRKWIEIYKAQGIQGLVDTVKISKSRSNTMVNRRKNSKKQVKKVISSTESTAVATSKSSSEVALNQLNKADLTEAVVNTTVVENREIKQFSNLAMLDASAEAELLKFMEEASKAKEYEAKLEQAIKNNNESQVNLELLKQCLSYSKQMSQLHLQSAYEKKLESVATKAKIKQ